MGSFFLFWIVGALVLFWAVGAYNRLVRLRAAMGKAFAALDELLVKQLVWVQGCVPESIRAGVSPAPGGLQDALDSEWARVFAASEQLAVAMAQARTRPGDGAAMASLVMAHEALGTAWEAAAREMIATGGGASAERLQQQRVRLLHQTLPLRNAFNEAVAAYNAAISGFPAMLLAKLFGFRPGGVIVRLASGASQRAVDQAA